MAKANLSLAEQELIKKEILHREAVINREGYNYFPSSTLVEQRSLSKTSFLSPL